MAKSKSSSVRLSKEFGLNPGLIRCEVCGELTNEIGIFGASYKENGKTAQVPTGGIVMHGALCDRCKKIIKDGGIFFLEVKKALTAKDKENPYRTGRMVAVKKEATEHMFTEGTKVGSINYMEEDIFEQLFGEALKEMSKEKDTDDLPKK